MLRKLLIAAVVILLILSIFPMISWWGSVFMQSVDIRKDIDLSGLNSLSVKSVSADIHFTVDETLPSGRSVISLTGKSNRHIELSLPNARRQDMKSRQREEASAPSSCASLTGTDPVI